MLTKCGLRGGVPIIERIARRSAERVLSHRHFGCHSEEGARKKIVKCVRRGENFGYITGELDPKMFEKKKFLKALRETLDDGGQAVFVFYKAPKYDDAVAKLKDENGGIWKLKKQFPDRLRLFHGKERLRKHYAYFGDDEVMIEEEHKSGDPRATDFYRSHALARRARESIDGLIDGNSRFLRDVVSSPSGC